MKLASVICIAFIFAAPATAAQACENRAACRAECAEIKRKIRRIHARMRSGYSLRAGEKMRAELRRLRERRLRSCR